METLNIGRVKSTEGVLRLNDADNQLLAKVTKELRCIVCQNQSLFDSKMPLAIQLRKEIAHQIQAGQSEAAILQFAVERYGNEIVYHPPFQPDTLILWCGPVFMLMLGCILFSRWVHRDPKPTKTTLY